MQLLGSNHICLLKRLVPVAAGSYAKFCCHSNSKSLRVGWVIGEAVTHACNACCYVRALQVQHANRKPCYGMCLLSSEARAQNNTWQNMMASKALQAELAAVADGRVVSNVSWTNVFCSHCLLQSRPVVKGTRRRRCKTSLHGRCRSHHRLTVSVCV